MKDSSLISLIEPSESDRILYGYGSDLVREYWSIARHLPITPQPVIELATGTGRMIAVLSTFVPSILTGDLSLTDLPRARKRVPEQFRDRVSFIQLDMERLPFRSGSIRSMVCVNTLHEVEHPFDCLQEMIRTTHPDGTLIVGDFNRKGFDLMQTVQQTVYHTDHTEGSITSAEILSLLSVAFRSITTFSTDLNTSYIATGKHSRQR